MNINLPKQKELITNENQITQSIWYKFFTKMFDLVVGRFLPLPSGVLIADGQETGNTGSSQTTLKTFSIPVKVFENIGDLLQLKIIGFFANNNNTKQIDLLLGNDNIFSSSSANYKDNVFNIEINLFKTSKNNQKCITVLNAGIDSNQQDSSINNTTKDELQSFDFIIKATGNSDNDIKIHYCTMQMIKNL